MVKKYVLAAVVVLPVVFATLAACEDPSTSAGANDRPDVGVFDGDRPESGGIDGAGPGDAGALPLTGSIEMLLVVGNFVSAGAYFYDSTKQAVGSCTSEQFGPCTFAECPTDAPPPVATTYLSAGSITITGGSPTTTIALAVKDGGSYGAYGPGTFPAGSGAAFKATGADVSAFEDTLVVPDWPVFTGPVFDAGTVVERTVDLDLTLSAPSAGSLALSNGNQYLTCGYLTPVTTFKIPAAAVAKLAAGNYAVNTFVSVNKTVPVGDKAVLLQLSMRGAAAPDKPYALSIKLQ